MRVEDVDRKELMDFQTTADLTDIDYDEPDTKEFETQLTSNDLEILGKDFNDGVGFFTNKLDIELIYKETPHFDIRRYQASKGSNSNVNQSFTTAATSNLGGSYGYGANLL